jgi:flagellar L-ring protein FlgH
VKLIKIFPLSLCIGCIHTPAPSPSIDKWPRASSSEVTSSLVSDKVPQENSRARLRLVSDEFVEELKSADVNGSAKEPSLDAMQVVSNVTPRDYRNEGVQRFLITQPSLYREGRGVANDPYHDYRAFQPYDLVTVVITEQAEGNRVANTNSRSQSTLKSAISGLFGLDDWFFSRNKGVDPTAAIDATSESEFRGQGQTLRSDKLKGTVSALVTEVLPSGVLAIEGKKVITVNGEAQTMVLTGLIRPRDVKSNNTIESTKVANMTIEFFGEGTIGGVQKPGWLYSFIVWIWPF